MKRKGKTQKVKFSMTITKEFADKLAPLSTARFCGGRIQPLIHSVMHWWSDGNFEKLDEIYREATHDSSRFKGKPCKVRLMETVPTKSGRWAKAIPGWQLFKVLQTTTNFEAGDILLVAEHKPSKERKPYGYWWNLSRDIESEKGHASVYSDGKDSFLGAWEGQKGMTVVGLVMRRFPKADFGKPEPIAKYNSNEVVLITDHRMNQVKQMAFV